MGDTKDAINFLEDARPYYDGDIKKYDKLMETLNRQIEPSGKHHCKSFLLELREPMKGTMELIS